MDMWLYERSLLQSRAQMDSISLVWAVTQAARMVKERMLTCAMRRLRPVTAQAGDINAILGDPVAQRTFFAAVKSGAARDKIALSR